MKSIRLITAGAVIGVASAFAQADSTFKLPAFCPDPSFCAEISAGAAFLGEGRECLLAKSKTTLTNLYAAITRAENIGIPQKPERAIAVLNALRKQQNLPPVTINNFSSAGISFVAVSLPKADVYALEFSSKEKNRIDIELQLVSVPEAVDRKVKTLPGPFYRVVALSKPLLDQLKIAGWSVAKLFLDTPKVLDIPCVTLNQ